MYFLIMALTKGYTHFVDSVKVLPYGSQELTMVKIKVRKLPERWMECACSFLGKVELAN